MYPEVEKSGEVQAFLETDKRRQEAQDRSDRRHLSMGDFEQEVLASKRLSQPVDDTYLEVVHRLELEELRSAIRKLTPEEKKLIYLYYYESWSMERIGKQFGISKMAVSKRHTKVIKRLRELMQIGSLSIGLYILQNN
ncbi:MAG: sigma-70 family RNA polymerase sigma factor [Clostridia bacterium]|nr:sigma-70 family RNA polymerase sigma factor [Clostridia bacterium]